MADQSLWGAVKSSLLSFLSPAKSEIEIGIAEKTREVRALQEYETLVKGFESADDDKHQSVENALERFKQKKKNN